MRPVDAVAAALLLCMAVAGVSLLAVWYGWSGLFLGLAAIGAGLAYGSIRAEERRRG